MEPAEDDHGLLRIDVFQHVAEQVHLRGVDLHILAVVGANVSAGDLLEPEQFHQGVGDRDFAGIEFRHQVPFERAVGAARLGSELARQGHVHLRRQVEDVLPACVGDGVELPVQLIEVVVVHDLVILIAAHHGEMLPEAVVRPAEDGRHR